MAKNGLSKEMIANIDAYSGKIKTLENFVTAVRKLPGMYIGPIGYRGLKNMIREIAQNGYDQGSDPNNPCDNVFIMYDMKDDYKVTVIDNGFGIPFADMERIFTKEHTSKNYTKQKGEYSSGLNGVGAKVVNALSSSFTVTSYHYGGTAKQMEFSKGKLKKEKNLPNHDKLNGTKVEFHPDHSIMGDTPLAWEELYNMIVLINSLMPIGFTTFFTAVDAQGVRHEETIKNTDGIITDLILKVQKPLTAPIMMSEDTGEMKVDIAFCFDSIALENGTAENITAFSNWCPTERGTHIDGFLEGVSRWFVKYMNNIYLNNVKNKIKVIQADTRVGLSAMISAAHLYPIFTGQAKEILSNEDMKPFVSSVVQEGLDAWAKANPQDLNKVCKFIKDIAEVRQKSDSEKIKLVTTYESNTMSGLPLKYRKPTGHKNLELIICEGDSAAGGAKSKGDPKRQGIFPIRGKIINAFAKSMKEVLANQEVQGIIAIIGAGYGKSFDLSKVKFEKIIFMADADHDGAHITALLLRLFLILFPGLIEDGRVYAAVPPLYSIPKGNKNIYFTDRIDYIRYTQKIFTSNTTVETIDGVKISPAKLTNIFAMNEDYVYHINTIARRYRVNEYMLEKLIVSHLSNTSFAKIKTDLQKSYRFIFNIEKRKNGIIVIEIAFEDKIHTIYFGDKLIEECKDIIGFIKRADNIAFKLNGEKTSLYGLMSAYKAMEDKIKLQRYKGLGEMDPDELAESTLLPDGERTLIKYTIDDVNETINMIRSYESDKTKIFQHVGLLTRNDLII